jgi:hypothetical protein
MVIADPVSVPDPSSTITIGKNQRPVFLFQHVLTQGETQNTAVWAQKLILHNIYVYDNNNIHTVHGMKCEVSSYTRPWGELRLQVVKLAP